MARKIIITLNEQSINDAIKWVEEEKKRIENAIHSFMKMLMDEGVRVAKANVRNKDTRETLHSIHAYFKDNKGVIVAGGKSIWLEFGTGVRKNKDGYPDELPEGIVPIGTYGQGKGSNLNGWYYYNEKKGEVQHTFGIKANKFMYYAKEHLISIAPQWANDLLKDL